MKNYEMETINILSFKNTELNASFYRPNQSHIKATILYFHGGGLVFGDRDDLPEKYIELLTAKGIAILAVDYPLAPETKMSDILDVSFKITDYFVHDFLEKIKAKDYFIMGRSAGGFLALSIALRANQFKNLPMGVISFYGYYNLNDPIFSIPNPHYLKYPLTSDTVISSLVQRGQVITKGDQNRFLLYLASRQKGDWMDLLLSSASQKREFSIPKDQIKKLPPLFLAAAKDDPDVPSRQSQQLAKFHPDADLTIYDLDEHDFDRTHQETVGLASYKKMIRWILDKI